MITKAALSPSQRDDLERRGAVLVPAYPGTELDLWLRNSRVRAALVRPDKTVMRAGRDIDEILRAVPFFAMNTAKTDA